MKEFRLFKFSCSLLVLFFDCHSLFPQTGYYSPEYVYRFAEHLFHDGDYLRAAGEFQRYQFISNPKCADSVFYKIGLCYELSSQPENAIIYFSKIVNYLPHGVLYDAANYEIAHVHFKSGEYAKSIEYVNANCQKLTSKNSNLRMKLLLGANYLFQSKWKSARDHFLTFSLDDPSGACDSIYTKLVCFALQSNHIQYKNYAIAGLLSTVVPGMGKVYCGRTNDGIYSLLVIGLTSWQAYDGFCKNGSHSFKGWVYGTLSTVFYIGNIYGSMVCVKLHNLKLEKNFLKQIDVDLVWNIE